MTLKFRSCRATMPDRRVTPQRHEADWKAHSRLVREKLLHDSLKMFLDLGLTPPEMSRTAGLPPQVIEEGLKRLDEAGRVPTVATGRGDFG